MWSNILFTVNAWRDESTEYGGMVSNTGEMEQGCEEEGGVLREKFAGRQHLEGQGDLSANRSFL